MTPADGGAAFPCSPGDVPFWNEGMSLRDWFAGQALSSVMGTAEHLGEASTEDRKQAFVQVAGFIYEMADAMLEARGK